MAHQLGLPGLRPLSSKQAVASRPCARSVAPARAFARRSAALTASQDVSDQPSTSSITYSSAISRNSSAQQPARAAGAATAAQRAAPVQSASPALPDWALRFMRQVPSLPQGRGALEGLLHSTNSLLLAAAGSEHRAVLDAYCRLVLVDIVAAAWTQQATYLQMVEAAAGPSQNCQQHQRQAASALCGCRYLRLEAVSCLAAALHTSLDSQGHSADLNLAALPKASEIGLSMPHLLTHGLGLDDLAHPALRQQQALTCSGWEEFCAASADPSLCGDWSFCEWLGGASFTPAPFAKFGTRDLARVLQPEIILSSLQQGVWGRCLAAAAEQAGLSVDLAWPVADGAAARAASAVSAGTAVDRLWRALLAANRRSQAEAAERAVASVQQAVLSASASASVAAAQLVDVVLAGGAVGGAGGVAAKPVVVARR